MSKLRLSYSAVSEYLECGRKYKLNRIDKIRPERYSSSFLFGSAVGAGAEIILGHYMKDNPNDQKDTKESVFLREMKKATINGVEFDDITDSELMDYRATDLQYELLTAEDIALVNDKIEELGFEELIIPDFLQYVKSVRRNVTGDDLKLFNYMSWLSLCRKGIMILDLQENWAKRSLFEVHAIEKKIQVFNEEGDEFIGYLDFDATFKDGVRRIMDWKTSGNPKQYYPDDAASTSTQLTIYANQEGVYEVGYHVADKVIRKRAPRTREREVYGTITEEQEAEVFASIDEVLHGIKAEEFEPNFDSCWNFGGCSFQRYCKSDCKDMTGLIKLEKK